MKKQIGLWMILTILALLLWTGQATASTTILTREDLEAVANDHESGDVTLYS